MDLVSQTCVGRILNMTLMMIMIVLIIPVIMRLVFLSIIVMWVMMLLLMVLDLLGWVVHAHSRGGSSGRSPLWVRSICLRVPRIV